MPKLRVGVVNIATPTPLKADGSFDRNSAKKLCKRWIQHQVDGVLIIGSMGEGPYLTDDVRNAFIETALHEVGDKITIFASAADTSKSRMEERAKRYAKMGAPCIVLCLPGVNTPAPQAIAAVKTVAEACPAPCAYYETPENTGTALVLNEMLDVLTHRNINVLKDSSNNPLIAYGLTSEALRPKHVKLLDGLEYRTPWSRMVGYDGVLHGGGAMTARWVRQIWDLVGEGKYEEAVAQDRSKALFLARVYNRFSRPLQNAMGQKYVLKLLGVLESDTVVINQSLSDADRERIRKAVEEYRAFIE